MSSKQSPKLSLTSNAEQIRRVIDLTVAAFGLLFLSPLFLALAVWVKLDSAGPVFYRALRVGKDGVTFRLFKYRTMVANADRLGPEITAAGDRRITRAGRFLRRTKLDELPQLINVLRGDMSLVGPRPEDPRYVALYSTNQRRVLSVRPGITSAASLAYRHEEELLRGDNWEQVYREQVMPTKLAIDLDYLEHRTIRSDLALIGRTIHAMLD